MGAVTDCESLLYLNASNNLLSDVKKLGRCRKLTYLNLAGNIIQSLAPLTTCHELEYLDLSGNKIRATGDLAPLQGIKTLKCLYLHGLNGEMNPCC